MEHQMDFIRNVECKEHYDVVVAGSGPGGVAAAITLGRLGKKVLLVESSACIGGYATAVMLGIILDMPGKGGIPREIFERLHSLGKAMWVDDKSYTYDIESMKYVLDAMVKESNVTVLLYSSVTATKVENGHISAILIDGPSPMAVSADWVVDGTGSGQVSFESGCEYFIGSENDVSVVQAASLQALVTGVPENLWHSEIHSREKKRQFKELLESVGHEPTYPAPLLFRLSMADPTCAFQINHEYNVRCDDPFRMSEATMEARKEIYESERDLKKKEGWETLTLVSTGVLGLRDGRRIAGLYKLTGDDGAAGKKFYDGVVPCSFCFDIHATTKKEADKVGFQSIVTKTIKPYEIPMRCLISKDIDNLFMVGRCISGDFEIHSSYRVIGPAFGMGEAVGVAISSLSKGSSNRSVDGEKVASIMKERGYKLGKI